jgi:DNA invertase Pin-like site-specific DNA recombinase
MPPLASYLVDSVHERQPFAPAQRPAASKWSASSMTPRCPALTPVTERPGFREMLAYMASNGARTVIVENASRFARDLIVQETGYQMLKTKGIELIAADAPDSFLSDTPTAALIRQILGAVHQFDKAMVVQKLKGARDRRSAKLGRRIEGNPAWRPLPAAHAEAARQAHSRGLSLGRAVAAELAAARFVSRSGKPYGPQSVKRMLHAPR